MMYANVGTGGGGGGGASGPDSVPSNRSSMVGTGSNRNSLKEPNSNRSSMDVSQSSYNTLIIHDDIIYGSVASSGREYASSPPPYMMKKERPRSYGESAVTVPQVTPMQDLTEITEEYINQSHVLKHLAKEVKLSRGPGVATRGHESHARDSGVLSEVNPRHGSRQQSTTSTASTERAEDDVKGGQKGPKSASRRGSEGAGAPGAGGNGKLKSKSQPDLTRLYDIDPEEVEAIVKENHLLKQQLNSCYLKVAKSQKVM